MVLICVPLIISDEHLFMHLLAICMSSLKKAPVPIFKIGLFGFFVVEMNEFFNIFWISAPYQIYDLQISSPIQ